MHHTNRYFSADLKRADDLLSADDYADVDAVPCPDEGFHGKQNEDLDEDVDEEEKKVVDERTQILRQVLGHVRHFVSMVRRPLWQIVALDIVATCAELMKMEQ